jgi:cysteinyl-tRNA synthetase
MRDNVPIAAAAALALVAGVHRHLAPIDFSPQGGLSLSELKGKEMAGVLKIFNTLTDQLEEFHPLNEKFVGMYTCGPTVYASAHIGNFRTFVFEDVLKRFLSFKGFQVKHVMNITDVDDKTIRDSKATEPAQLREYTDHFTQGFFEDCKQLKMAPPEVVCHATAHIPEMIALIELLRDKGFTYEKEGSVYYRISQFQDYGKLAKLDAEGIRAGARVDVDEYEKQDARDFVLWKAAKPGEPSWESPFGPGRPGWHIECSAMSLKYLGETFDLHCGAVDLIFPHHENEIAQSEAATGKPFVRYWMHGEHLIVNGEKMSKSKGNYFTLQDLLQRGLNPLVIRYALASVPYKRKLNFTDDAVHQAESALKRLEELRLRLTTDPLKLTHNEILQAHAHEAQQRFEQAMDDDLNTAQALAAIFDLVREANTALAENSLCSEDAALILAILEKFNGVLQFWEPLERTLDQQIQELIEQRNQARQARNFARSDEIRAKIYTMGYVIEDTREGVRWKKR